MRPKTTLILAAAAALTCCISAFAQDAAPTPPPPPGGHPHSPPPPGAPGESAEHRHWQHGEPGADGARPEARPHEGSGPEAWHHDGARPDGAERDGRPEGEHHFGGPHGEHGEHGRPPEPPKQPKPFLGVIAAPAPPAIAAQLGLTEGFGLLVMEVLPDGPAAKAGVQKYDVLKLLNDQQLVDTNQLSALLRAAGKDKDVVLTVIRKAQEQKLTAKVGEHLAPVGPGPHGEGFHQFGFPEFHDRIRAFHHHFEEHAEKFRQDGHGPHEKHFEGHGEGHGPQDHFGPRAEVSPEEILKEAQPDGGSELQVLTDSGLTTVEGAKAHLFVKDGDGEIEVTANDGKRILTARNSEGEVVFTGPVDTEEQRKAVPEAVRSKLESIKVKPISQAAAPLSNETSTDSPETPEAQ
jgi:hypothetical protein